MFRPGLMRLLLPNLEEETTRVEAIYVDGTYVAGNARLRRGDVLLSLA